MDQSRAAARMVYEIECPFGSKKLLTAEADS
jgi:hypothetical protein